MYHLRRIKVLLATCLLASASLWAQDTKITISSATASSYHKDFGASNAIDGIMNNHWHSGNNGSGYNTTFPVIFTITLSQATHVDYVRYFPRTDSSNGHWNEVTVSYCSTTTGSSFTDLGSYKLNGEGSIFDFPIGETCGQVKFTINSGKGGWATATEIEAYAYNTEKIAAFKQYFTDDLYTQLKSGVTSSNGIEDDDVKALVDAMLADAEDYKKFRVGEYEPYMTTATVRNNLKTNSLYNNYENPTGIYLKRGESCIIAVSGIGNYPVGLKIKDWYKSGDLSTYKLHNGLNFITATTEGNVFVDYYTDDFEIAPNVQMHFINAPVLGYWDQATMTNADWGAMLRGPLAEDDVIIITRSEHAQTAYPVKQWKTYCSANVNETMTYYQQVQWAERDIMGLEMFGRQVKNRQLFYADKSGSMYAGGDASVCGYGDLRVLVTPDAKVFDFWGVGHEWGHNNQMAGFHWTGCGETTNNIPASWAQFKFTGNRDANGNPTNLRLEDEVTGINDYKGMRGGRMQTYFEEGLRKGVQWQLQDGPDWHAETPEAVTVTGRDENGNDLGQVNTTWRHYDHFVKLAPFWQLNLWGTVAEKNPYIITKVIESIRATDNYTSTYNTNGKQQINWMKLACEAAEMDLLLFFEKAGMLRPIHAYVDDYTKGWNIITEEMIAELKAYVEEQGYPAFTEEINYINGHNYHIYRDKLKLNVASMQGTLNGDKVKIQHSVAQNAVAFETYNVQDKLIRITMYGLGSNDEHSFTQVLFPSDADYVMAVGYDGERQKVYQKRTADELQTLISEAESLLSAVGSVNNPVAQKVELTANNYYCNALYEAEDNDDKFTSYEVLRDGNPSTYLHTDYSGNAPSENHYVTIDLGSGNELTFFNLNYTTRYEGYACAPTQVTIEASNDNKTWVTLRSVTSGLNSANNAQNTIAGLGDGTPYRYIRMTVLETSTSTDYFVLSEMGLSKLSYDVNLQPSYSLISTGVVVAAHLALQSAQEVVNNGTDYTTAYIALQKSVDALLAHPLVDVTKYYTLACKATDHDTYIRDNGSVINGRSAEGSLFQFEAADEDNGYYIKSYVSDKYLNCTANENTGNDAVVESEEKSTVWKMAKHTEGVVTLTAGHDKYLNNNGDAPTYLLARYHDGGPASSNACSLWTLTEGTPLDKSALNTLIGETNTLIEACYTDEEFNYAGSLNVTEELMTATREAVAAAQEKYDSKATTESEYEAALTALQTVKDNLQTAIAYATLPVKLTYDANSPVTYKIAIARSDLSVLAYDESSAMVAVSDFKLGNKAHGWYFMPATDGKVYIMPYYVDNTTLALSTNSFEAGNSKVKGMAVGSNGYTQGWTITNANLNDDNRENGWYNITCTSNGTDTWYFSNHGGVANKMGFLNDANDGGSRFKFEQITFDKSEAYYTLYNYYMSDTKVASSEIQGGTVVGCYPEAAAEAYNTAYRNAANVLENATATDEEYTNAYHALKAANEALNLIMPEVGKYYRFVSVVKKNDETYANVYANPADNKMYWAADKATGDATAMWTFVPLADGKFAVTNLHTGSSINTFINYNPSPLGETAGEVSIVSLSLDGQIGIKCGDRMMHAQGGGAVVHWETGADDGSAWRIVEVDVNAVMHTATLKYEHASLFLNYAVAKPEGVKAYYIDGTKEINIVDGVGELKLTELEGDVIPARTAVILYAPEIGNDAKTYDFYYTADDSEIDNLLTGSAYTQYLAAEADHAYYSFGQKEGQVGLYKNSVKYVYDDEQSAYVEAAEGATHYKVSANKVLFDWDASSQGVTSFRFRMGDEETGIEGITIDADATIYDLYGRRVLEVVTPGLYIVNGEKRYVKVK